MTISPVRTVSLSLALAFGLAACDGGKKEAADPKNAAAPAKVEPTAEPEAKPAEMAPVPVAVEPAEEPPVADGPGAMVAEPGEEPGEEPVDELIDEEEP